MDEKKIIDQIKEDKRRLKQFKKDAEEIVAPEPKKNTNDIDTDYGVGEDINQEEFTDDTDFGEEIRPTKPPGKQKKPVKKIPPKTTPKQIKKYTEEELRNKLKDLEAAKKPKLTTTMIIKALTALDKMKKNTDGILLLLHTLFCLCCGAILGLGIYLKHPALQIGGGFTGFISFLTLLLTYLSPKGNLRDLLDKENLLDELNNLPQKDFQKLWNEINNTNFFKMM